MFEKIKVFVAKILTVAKWKQKNPINDGDRQILREALKQDYYIIATRRGNYLSSFVICLGHFLLTGRWVAFTHTLMNLEDEVEKDSDFRFIEANVRGTMYSTFDEVFHDVDSVALIKPWSMTVEEWTDCLDAAKDHLGKPYDSLLDLKSDREVNCVELIRLALMRLPDYHTRFAKFEKMIKRKFMILTPQMFFECPDFHVYYRITRS